MLLGHSGDPACNTAKTCPSSALGHNCLLARLDDLTAGIRECTNAESLSAVERDIASATSVLKAIALQAGGVLPDAPTELSNDRIEINTMALLATNTKLLSISSDGVVTLICNYSCNDEMCVDACIVHVLFNTILQKTTSLLYNSYDEENRFIIDEK